MSFISNSSASVSLEGRALQALEAFFGKSKMLNSMVVTPLAGQKSTPMQKLVEGVITNEDAAWNFARMKSSINERFSAIEEAPKLEERVKANFGKDFSEKILFKSNCEWIPGFGKDLDTVLRCAEQGQVEMSALLKIEKEVELLFRCKSLAERALGKEMTNLIFSSQLFALESSIAETFLDAVMLNTKAANSIEKDVYVPFDEVLFLDVPGFEDNDGVSDEGSTEDAFSSDSELELDEAIWQQKTDVSRNDELDIYFREEGPLELDF